MNEFIFYLSQGFEHILDINGIDHFLFLTAICVYFPPAQWRKILLIITAFTIGHSIALALAAFNVVPVNSYLIELLIPITIIITCSNTLFKTTKQFSSSSLLLYVFVTLFGIIHGLGFSNFFKSMLFDEGDSIVLPLLGFNLGIEIGQIIIVSAVVLLVALLLKIFKNLRSRTVTVAITILILLMSIKLLIDVI